MYREFLLLLDTDIPYLDPLLFHLREDPILKKYFTDKSYFMPHSNLITATEEAMKADCPAPRAIWVMPGDTVAPTPKANCRTIGNHTFNIIIFVQCIRDTFQLSLSEDKVVLTGQFMELAQIRKAVKKSILEFGKTYSQTFVNRTFEEIMWIGDQMLYPDDTNQFLVSSTEYQVKIL